MILVNTPGSWAYIYPPLRHANWHGCTPTDLVFPFFLFATGAAMFFSFAKNAYRPNPSVLRGIARRSVLLFAIGVFLNAYPFTSPMGEWRIPGVLQRIGLAYAGGALLVLYCPGAIRIAASAVILLGYWFLLWSFGGSDPYALESNIVRRVDIAMMGESHLWNGMGIPFDPEGLLSTLPAMVSVVAGFEAARVLRRATGPNQSMLSLILVGAIAVGLALLWSEWLPINKALWTSTYVLYTSGICWLTLAVVVLMVDRMQLRSIARPFQIYGTNPLFIYILSILEARTLWLIKVSDGSGGETSLYTWLYTQLLGFTSPINASLIFALSHVILFWLLSWVLYKKGIVIKL